MTKDIPAFILVHTRYKTGVMESFTNSCTVAAVESLCLDTLAILVFQGIKLNNTSSSLWWNLHTYLPPAKILVSGFSNKRFKYWNIPNLIGQTKNTMDKTWRWTSVMHLTMLVAMMKLRLSGNPHSSKLNRLIRANVS